MTGNPPSTWDARLDGDMRRLLRRLATAAARVRAQADDEAVHDLRVTARRLDAALDLWRPLLGRGARRRARRGLRALRRRLGPPREAEVGAAMLRERLERLPPATRVAATLLLAQLTRRVGRGRRRAAAWCSAERIGRIRRRVARAFARRGSPAAAEATPALRARLERLERRAQNATRAATEGRDEPLHEARIATKRLRYALERLAAVGPPFDAGGESGRTARLVTVQEALGHISDLTVLQRRIARFSRRLAAADLAATAALEPLAALIASERAEAVGSFVASVAVLGAVPAQPASLGLAGRRPRAGADHR